jgi:hypothetical protein
MPAFEPGSKPYNKLDVSAILEAGTGAGNTGGNTGGGNTGGSGNSGGGSTPTITNDGTPSTREKGPALEFDTGQRVMCATGSHTCSVDMTVRATIPAAQLATKRKPKRRTVVLGHTHLTVPAGGTAQLVVKFNAEGRRLLAKLRHLTVQLTTAVSVGTGTPISHVRSIRITQPKPKKKH